MIDSVRVASAFGYTAQDLQDAPAESHMGLACGNPVANASIKEVSIMLRRTIDLIPMVLGRKDT